MRPLQHSPTLLIVWRVSSCLCAARTEMYVCAWRWCIIYIPMHAGLVDAPTTIMTPYAQLDDEDEDADDEDFADLAHEDGQEEAGGDAKGRNNLELVLGLLHQMTFKALIREKDVDSERNAVLNGEWERGWERGGIDRDRQRYSMSVPSVRRF